MTERPCQCGLCRPEPGKRYDPEYGFDLDEVRKVNCTACGQPIGDEPYRLDTSLARFGQMLFSHKKCEGVL